MSLQLRVLPLSLPLLLSLSLSVVLTHASCVRACVRMRACVCARGSELFQVDVCQSPPMRCLFFACGAAMLKSTCRPLWQCPVKAPDSLCGGLFFADAILWPSAAVSRRQSGLQAIPRRQGPRLLFAPAAALLCARCFPRRFGSWPSPCCC